MERVKKAFRAACGSKAFPAACGSKALRDGSPEQQFVREQRDKFAPGKRPAPHPYDCDFRDDLGLPHIRFNNNDVAKHAKRANFWWHPDHRKDLKDDSQAAQEAFLAFKEVVRVLKNPALRKRYVEEVDVEYELAGEDGQGIDWRRFNRGFLKRAVDKERSIVAGEFRSGSKVRVHSLSQKVGFNGMLGTCMEFRCGRWCVHLPQLGEVKAFLPKNLEAADKPDQISMCHVFLMAMPKVGDALVASSSHMVELEHKEAEVMSAWAADASCTFLWEYVFAQVKDLAELEHEVVIITDGEDNQSSAKFSGLEGFNQLMSRMGGKRLRISLFLIGNSMPSGHASSYRDLCLATGGIYHHSPDGGDHALAVEEFVAPLLLTEAERDLLAQEQQAEYLRMLRHGDAKAFEWFQPLPSGDPSDGHPSAGSSSSGSGWGRAAATPAARTSRITQQVTVTEIP
eukprot:CAMPEP_0175710626 /NCGR_PEP_ID=MMETSP0097-20121207/40178_1 /TAXON_ID=311494 /ORGANISM="Alexandrium monilatum, Strain CCMP3105" /LENGTH=454 /DNA_ID=CAMNT_0017018049 /DNA_START=11 /DNA_END=1374 /DNA_ORIENTATION=+